MMLFFANRIFASLVREKIGRVGENEERFSRRVILTVHESGNRRWANAMDDGTDVPTLFGGKPERDHDCVSD